MKYKNIKVIFSEYSDYFTGIRKQIENDLAKLPKKGSVVKKKIKKYYYYYLVYRDGNKIIFKYLGKKEPKRLKEKIIKRRKLLKQLREVKDALYALGISKRIPRGTVSKRFEVFKRDNFTCFYCGRNVKKHKAVLTIDHIIPKKRGGSDDVSNLVTACLLCNLGKHKHYLTTKM